jgi:hypothetical protein
MESFCFLKECFITIDWPFKCWIIFVIFWFPFKKFFRVISSLRCKNRNFLTFNERGGRGKPPTLTKSPTPYFSLYEGGGGGLLVLKESYFSLSFILFYRKHYIFHMPISSLALLIRARNFYFKFYFELGSFFLRELYFSSADWQSSAVSGWEVLLFLRKGN